VPNFVSLANEKIVACLTSSIVPLLKLGSTFTIEANEIPLCPDDQGVLLLYSTSKKMGEFISIFFVTATSAEVQKIFNMSLPAHASLQQAVQCSIHEVLRKTAPF
jgi:hypothetical protein